MITPQNHSFPCLNIGHAIWFNHTFHKRIKIFHDFTTSGTISATTKDSLTIFGNLTIGNGTNLNIDTNALNITGDINQSADITSISGSINIKGNWNNKNGIFYPGTGTVNYCGSNNTQNIAYAMALEKLNV